MCEHERERAVDPPLGTAGIEIGASVGVPAPIDVMVEVEGRVDGARLNHRVVDTRTRDTHPGHDIGVHGQPVLPVDNGKPIARLAFQGGVRNGRRVYVHGPAVDVEEPNSQHRSADQCRYRCQKGKPLLDVRLHRSLQNDRRGGSNAAPPFSISRESLVTRRKPPWRLPRRYGRGCEARMRPLPPRRRPGR